MKTLYLMLSLLLAQSVWAQGRPGVAGGSEGGNRKFDQEHGPHKQLIKEYIKRVKECDKIEVVEVNLFEMYEWLQVKEMRDNMAHDSLICKHEGGESEHDLKGLKCLLTDNFKAQMKRFARHKDALELIQDSYLDSRKSKLSKENAQAMLDYFKKVTGN